MPKSDVKIWRDENGCHVKNNLHDYELLSMLGIAEQIVLGEQRYGEYFNVQNNNMVIPTVELYYEERGDGSGKVTVTSTESRHGTMSMLESVIKQVACQMLAK